MIVKRHILTSATSSVAQVVVSGISLLLLYKFLLQTIGVAQLGIWSLVLAISSTVQAANFGLTGTIVKTIADYNARQDRRSMAGAVQTASISVACLSLLILGCAYWGAKYYFAFAMDPPAYQQALDLLPVALLAFWISMVTGIYQSGLYGCQLIAHSNIILILDSIGYLCLCLYLAPRYGLAGIAYGRVIQNVATLLISVTVLKRHLPYLPWLPRRWDKTLFKEMWRYATAFQFISLMTMLADPVTKAFLGRFGTMSMVGYFEMASRLVQQCRALMVGANQVLVPTFAHIKQLEPHRIASLYLNSYRLTFYLALAGFGLLATCAPLISDVWIGRYEPFFVWSVIVLCVGWFANTLSLPAYYACMGTGMMRFNVVSHVIISLVNLLLSLTLGWWVGGLGVVLSWGSALVIGSVWLLFLFTRANRISVNSLLPHPDKVLAYCCLAGIVVTYVIWAGLRGTTELSLFLSNGSPLGRSFVLDGAMVLVYTAFMIVPLWSHPTRKNLQRWVQEALATVKF
jgi:O-antigen/teichoic acid export membrane protein